MKVKVPIYTFGSYDPRTFVVMETADQEIMKPSCLKRLFTKIKRLFLKSKEPLPANLSGPSKLYHSFSFSQPSYFTPFPRIKFRGHILNADWIS